jgi:transcription antitermination factor NusG
MAWFVAISEPARQRQAVDLLSEMNFSAYAPKCCKTIVKGGRRVEVPRFLFGTYFFIYMRAGWEAIIPVRFVRRVLLGPELQPVLIRDKVVEHIRSREVDGCISTEDGFRLGQAVTPRIGHLVGIAGKFYRSHPQGDIALFDILGVETPVDFAPGVLEPIIEHKKKRKRRHRRSYCIVDHVTRRDHLVA